MANLGCATLIIWEYTFFIDRKRYWLDLSRRFCCQNGHCSNQSAESPNNSIHQRRETWRRFRGKFIGAAGDAGRWAK